jgi:hypothetical protein
MHYKTKEKYLKLKESGLTQEELKAQLLTDGITEEEANAFITEAFSGMPTTVLPNKLSVESSDSNVTNTDQAPAVVPETAAQQFDYKNLTGQNFKNYEAHVNTLPLFNLLDFKVYKVKSLIKELYPGLPNSPKVFDGIEIVNDKPIHNTRIDVKTALEMNAQVRNTGRYYLLA